MPVFKNSIFLFILFGSLLLIPTIVSASALPTIVITPVNGSKVPGCQDQDGCFQPDPIRTKVGSLIIFKNTDTAAHSFTSDKFNSKLMIDDGSEFRWIVDQGRTEYTCILHPWTTGTIIGINAPTIDTISNYPKWVVILFDWYDADVIEYDTFITALTWLMNNGIVESAPEPEQEQEPEPEPEPKETSSNEMPSNRRICENVLCN